jgi:hypothetical protein
MNPDDWSLEPEAKAWISRVRTHLIPKLDECGLTVSLVPEDHTKTDVKFAVELGLSIMFDKPIILVVKPGTSLPDHLVRVADGVVEGGPGDPGFQERFMAEMKRVMGDDFDDV